MGFRDILGPCFMPEKSTKFTKIFELYQVLMYTFICQTVRIFPNYILLTRWINKFWNKPGLHMSKNASKLQTLYCRPVLKPFYYLPTLSVKFGLVKCHGPDINNNDFAYIFLSALCFLNLLPQVKSLTWIIVSGLYLSKCLWSSS